MLWTNNADNSIACQNLVSCASVSVEISQQKKSFCP